MTQEMLLGFRNTGFSQHLPMAVEKLLRHGKAILLVTDHSELNSSKNNFKQCPQFAQYLPEAIPCFYYTVCCLPVVFFFLKPLQRKAVFVVAIPGWNCFPLEKMGLFFSHWQVNTVHSLNLNIFQVFKWYELVISCYQLVILKVVSKSQLCTDLQPSDFSACVYVCMIFLFCQTHCLLCSCVCEMTK